MIGGQYRDITGDDDDLAELHRLKTGRLFVGVGSARPRRGRRVPADARAPWLAFGDEVGLLFQIVDDILDGDGYAGAPRRATSARRLADERRGAELERSSTRIDADTSVLARARGRTRRSHR